MITIVPLMVISAGISMKESSRLKVHSSETLWTISLKETREQIPMSMKSNVKGCVSTGSLLDDSRDDAPSGAFSLKSFLENHPI
jgi:hypothetical protein